MPNVNSLMYKHNSEIPREGHAKHYYGNQYDIK
ncbi:hypothetical protein N478_08775 [Pseudoalteromonas luteoviolacea S4060-1]|uniref:Uncharacterized protein n=1 Tax=Pseudoalteromonas luteoviolacea S4060-1 TaxID=1365257 RepID=A0A167IAC8_9GAMM|nr:hypothetical protein N478_08775 [Pseudoalteromonas luteoviolacea S4060-1]